MGTGGRHQCGGSDIKKIRFPKNNTAAIDGVDAGVPRLRYKKPSKGGPIRVGRTQKFGLSPEEELMQYAPGGSVPERMVYGWLVRHDMPFQYQVSVLGGRQVPGGAVLDFVIYARDVPIVVRLQSYWHQNAEQQWRDSIQLSMLTELGMVVEDVDEYEVNTVEKVDRKMQEVIFGRPKFGASAGYDQDYRRECPHCDDPNCTWCEVV